MTKTTFTIAKASDIAPLVQRMAEYFERGGVKPLMVGVSQSSGKPRSNAENRYYHGVIVQKALEHYEAHPMDLIKDVMEAARINLNSDFVHELIKVRFGVKSTAKLDTTGFEELMLRIRQHFAEMGTQILEPSETNSPTGQGV